MKGSMEGMMEALMEDSMEGSMESPVLASRSMKNGGPCATVVAYGGTVSRPLSRQVLPSVFAVSMLEKSDLLSCGWAVGDVLRDGRDK